MFTALGKKWKAFRSNNKGGVLVFASLCILPLMLVLGLAVDSSVGLGQKRKLQMACDAAAKAGSANGQGVTATITSEATKVFTVNTAGMTGVSGPAVSVNTSANTVTVSASVTVSNTFMALGGFPTNTYNATATAPLSSATLSEIAIVYEVSNRFQSNNFHQKICDALITFVNSLPSNAMVSITPIATEILLDPETTVSSNLFSNLSSTTNDESAYPALFPLSPNLAWTSANYNSVTNLLYTDDSYALFPTDPGVLMSYPSPGTCTIPVPNYASCAPLTWPTKCPISKKPSCSQVYSYTSNTAYPILPLTLNKTLIVNYLNNLKSFVATADGMFPSLISWGWRTIDPNWKNFWLVNSNATSTLRSSGAYPNAYGTNYKKSMVIIVNSTPYWDDYTTNVEALYVNKCGDATQVLNGVNHWWMTTYGMVPVPTDRQSYVNDIACENRWYQTMDKALGLSLSSNAYNASVSSSSYRTSILNEVRAKFFRICNNIKAKDIDIYLLANRNTSTLSPCCNSSSQAYIIGNSATSITTALNAVQTQIASR